MIDITNRPPQISNDEMINQLLNKDTVIINPANQQNPVRQNMFTIVPKTNRGRELINNNIIRSFIMNDSLMSQPVQPADTVLGVLSNNTSSSSFQVKYLY